MALRTPESGITPPDVTGPQHGSSREVPRASPAHVHLDVTALRSLKRGDHDRTRREHTSLCVCSTQSSAQGGTQRNARRASALEDHGVQQRKSQANMDNGTRPPDLSRTHARSARAAPGVKVDPKPSEADPEASRGSRPEPVLERSWNTHGGRGGRHRAWRARGPSRA